MSQYPVFSGSPFAANTNQLPFNLNQNFNNPLHVTPFQQNANMSFLSFPPPSLPGSHHVFQNGPRFPGVMNAMQPAVFATNTLGNPSMMASSAFAANVPNGNMISPLPFASNVPNGNMISPSPFATNVPNGNMISPSPFASNSTLAAMTSLPPPQGSPMWNPMSLNQTQSSNVSNGSSSFRDTGIGSGSLQQTPQKFNAQSMNPWSPAPSNNFQNSTSNAINPWAVDPSKANGSFNIFQSGSSNSNPIPSTFQTSVSPWASDSNSSNFMHNFQGNPVRIKESPSKFRQSKSPASDINPWAQPSTITTGSAIDNHQLSNEHGRQNQHNFNANRFNKPNFNNRRGNSRFFPNNNYRRQDRNFKGEGDFKKEPNEPKPHSCDTCDRSFTSEVEFRDHMADHIKCNFKNCHFEAHPKIVALHKRMQHDTGYADAINKLKSDEEIEKWRAERRRRFPTAANILKRKAEQAEKEARGEVIENKEFGKFKRQNTEQREERNNNFANRKRGRNNKRNKRMEALSAAVTVSDSGSDSDDSHIKLRKFSGILAVPDVFNTEAEISNRVRNSPEKLGEPLEIETSESSKNEHLDSHSPEEAEENEETSLNKKMESMDKSIKGSASSDLINLESDDDGPIEFTVKKQSNINDDKESDDSPIEICVSKVPCNEISNSTSAGKNPPFINAKKDDTESDDDSPIEIPVSKVPLNEISNSTSMVAKNKSPNDGEKGDTEVKTGRNSSKPVPHKRNSNRKYEHHHVNPGRKNTLLEKLLADDIRHERNVIMQCIRHVVKKKFFGIGSDA